MALPNLLFYLTFWGKVFLWEGTSRIVVFLDFPRNRYIFYKVFSLSLIFYVSKFIFDSKAAKKPYLHSC